MNLWTVHREFYSSFYFSLSFRHSSRSLGSKSSFEFSIKSNVCKVDAFIRSISVKNLDQRRSKIRYKIFSSEIFCACLYMFFQNKTHSLIVKTQRDLVGIPSRGKQRLYLNSCITKGCLCTSMLIIIDPSASARIVLQFPIMFSIISNFSSSRRAIFVRPFVHIPKAQRKIDSPVSSLWNIF